MGQLTSIVITGASSGIGQALAEYYAASGVVLGLTGRDAARLDAVARVCRAKRALVETRVLDVTDAQGMAAWLTDFDARHPIDILVANAGVGGGGALEPTVESLQKAHEMFKININGVENTINPVLPRMAARHSGQIALLASIAGFRGLSGAPAYAASKGFVKLYGEGLRGAMAPHGIKINVICPGFVESRITGFNDFYMPFLMPATKAARIIAAGLQKNRARIAFPAPMVFGVWLLAALPAAWSDALARLLPAKR